MRFRSLVMITAVAAIMSSPCGSVTTSPRSASLQVEISVDKNHPPGPGDCFWLDTRITNAGSTNEEIIVWTNYAWSWISESPAIVLNVSALSNVPSHELLKPKQRHSEKLYVCRSARSKQPTSFRLGFVPRADGPATLQDNLATWGGIFWSNPVALSD